MESQVESRIGANRGHRQSGSRLNSLFFGVPRRHGWLVLPLLVLTLAACSFSIPFIGDDAAETPPPDPEITPEVATATPSPTVVLSQSVAAVPTPTAPPPPPTLVSPLVLPTAAPVTPIIIVQTPNVADTVERVRPAVVSVLTEVVGRDIFGNPQSNFSSGSGVIIAPSGLVLTNNHVVRGAASVTVTMDDGRQLSAIILGGDRLSDLAVLQLPMNQNYPHVPLNGDVPLRVGDWVIAIGNALALPGGPTVTVGVVSALGRSLDVDQEVTLYDLIQTDSVINPGNSGGPLLNVAGELVGINTAVVRSGAGGNTVEGIGFAINMETASLVSEQLITSGRVRWSWMGAFLEDLVPERAAQARLPIRQGVIIEGVVPGGPADRAGIRPNDIILSLAGQQVDSVRTLTQMLRQDFRVSQQIDVVLFRDQSTMVVTLTLGERPR